VDAGSASALLTSASLIVAFFGGAIMLFAPCCITLMLPAYLGTVFKSRSKVIFLTSVFALGVASIILPIVLGARFLTSFLSAFHPYVFATGALLMIGVGVMTLYGKRLKMPFVSRLQSPRVTNAASAYALGVVSGISSACCAPVVLGALTLAAISPTLLQAGAVGLAYTFGIVFPLFVLGLFYKQGLWRKSQKLQKSQVRLGSLTVPLSNFLSFIVFTLAGVSFLILSLLGWNTASSFSSEFSIKLKSWVDVLAGAVEKVPFGEALFGLLLIALLVFLVRLVRRELKQPDDDESGKHV
jgi:cytochrome c-type biogenesis protein